ncbi:uncharacterized protein LOC121775022 isoform X1 [Salvia splendens]|uniref:uncharacterized protein LOC121775022 isoform X1 n=1 Tax=Salvia splendens TaxID=180675 RepID=UPI001C27E606|nr:uncharacterized protein LOC121775022 isoform X1 [Salvia splendens]XP_042027897.1 uncharacterized protein LOC121775022 isoform X1 [Salvia splendens]
MTAIDVSDLLQFRMFCSDNLDYAHLFETWFPSASSVSLAWIKIPLVRQFMANDSETVWYGGAWICSKQLKHYKALCTNGTKIPVHSVVWILGGGGKDYLGYVEDMYETLQEEKMVRVRRFLFPEDIQHLMPKLCSDSGEVFITSTKEQLSAKEIDGLASVLAPIDFKKCDEVLPLNLSLKIFTCHREFKSNSVSTFNITELCGYYAQPVLSTLKYFFPEPSDAIENSTQEGDDCSPQNQAVITCKSNEILIGDQIVSEVDADLHNVAKDNQAAKRGPANQCLKIKQAMKGPVQDNNPLIWPQNQMLSRVNENIELLSQDSGMRGCWFRCKILRSSAKLMRVQYCDVTDADEDGNLEELVVAPREAATDRLGMRCAGRLTVRPWPSWYSSDARFEVGEPVDVWQCPGWWEGVVIGFDPSAENTLQVYFPGENILKSVKKRNTRVSKDWVGEKWVDIMANRDILALVTSCLNAKPKVSLPESSGDRESD